MKIQLLVVGRTTNKHLDTLISDYVSRLKHYLPFDIEVIPDLKNAKSLSFAQQKEREGELILKSLKDGDRVVLLDEGGKSFRSVDFARHLDKIQTSTARRIVFVVGGAYGFSDAVYRAAHEKMSLSSMTFSHQMVRLFIVEQIYRAMTILKGEPYHHE